MRFFYIIIIKKKKIYIYIYIYIYILILRSFKRTYCVLLWNIKFIKDRRIKKGRRENKGEWKRLISITY